VSLLNPKGKALKRKLKKPKNKVAKPKGKKKETNE
tara:strand:+ start:1737 stop:1841 length:105 start_codon:yes stop_codon:yes gene_type:complete